jgi:hypothetical protein
VATPTSSGIYVATLRSDRLVPVTQDIRYVETCARVNCFNVKVGKARDLSRRERDYWRDFGPENVSFTAIATTTEIRVAETAILRKLRSFRKSSPKGGMMDWLENITVGEAATLAYEALSHAGIRYERL